MALSAQAALLDELMGRNRNLGANEKRKPETKWDDTDICKHYLCGFCPHDLFVNTKADLGRCEKIHEEDMKKDYEESTRKGRMGYEEDFERYLNILIVDVDRKIRRGHERLAMNAALANSRINSTKEERTDLLTSKINELVQQAEELGTQGNVEEAQGVMKLCDQLVEERTQLENATTKDTVPAEFEKEMEVCEICGALLVVNDVQQRVDEHLMGKQHMGYARIRAHVSGLKEKRNEQEVRKEKEREEREAGLEQRRKERHAASEERKREERRREEEIRRRRSRSRDKRRSQDNRGSSHSKRHRSRERQRNRSRTPDRGHSSSHRHSHSHDRRDRRRSRSQDRHRRESHNKSSRHSSRDRDRKNHRHRSRERHSKDHKDPDTNRDRKRSSSTRNTNDSKTASPEPGTAPVENDQDDTSASVPRESVPASPTNDNGEDMSP